MSGRTCVAVRLVVIFSPHVVETANKASRVHAQKERKSKEKEREKDKREGRGAQRDYVHRIMRVLLSRLLSQFGAISAPARPHGGGGGREAGGAGVL
jgi:hypothetical protein